MAPSIPSIHMESMWEGIGKHRTLLVSGHMRRCLLSSNQRQGCLSKGSFFLPWLHPSLLLFPVLYIIVSSFNPLLDALLYPSSLPPLSPCPACFVLSSVISIAPTTSFYNSFLCQFQSVLLTPPPLSVFFSPSLLLFLTSRPSL